MEDKILSKIEELSNDMIQDIIKIVKIDSTEKEEAIDAPFGKGVKEALDLALKMSKELGFSTKNLDNYIGYAQYGEGNEYICAIGHLDVVPVGEGWNNPPFSGYIENNTIYSRGVLDNKGPIISCLYAMYALKELNIKTKFPVRVIFGCDEETGFEDLEYYLEKEKPPIMGFTPDCKYPVVYAETGRATLTISAGINSIKEFFKFINTYFLNAKNNGEKLGINFENKEYDSLQLRNYILEENENEVKFVASISYPFGIDCDTILEKVNEEICKFEGVKATVFNRFLPVNFPKDSFLVKSLQYAYEKVTGLDGSPVTTSGGTYAKMMPNIVPFGPSFPGQKDISHNPNEWMKIDDIILNAKIFALGLYRLATDDNI